MSVENIEYKSKKSEVESSIDSIKNDIELLPKVLSLFSKIDIKNLSIDGNSFKILFDNEFLKIDNKFISLNSKIDISSKQVSLYLDSLYLKDYEVLFKGTVKLDYFEDTLKYFGDIYYKDLIIKSNLDITKDKLSFFVRSEYFENIHFLKQILEDLPQIANEWMYDNVTGDFKVDWFYGEFDLNKNEIIEKSLQGEAHIKDAKVKFEPSLEAIQTKNVVVKFKNSALRLDLIDAIYKSKELKNSYVLISDIADEKKGRVLVNIETKSALDKDILGILKAYNIILPVLQKSGLTDAKLSLDFPYNEDLELQTKGEFLLDSSKIDISGFEFKTDGGKVVLNNDLLDINSDFTYKDMIKAKADLILNLDSLKAIGSVKIDKISIKDSKNNSILNIKDKNSSISMDFSKNVNIELDDLKTQIYYDEYLKIDIKDLSKIYKSSNILNQYNITTGNLSLKIFDEKDIEFEAYLSGFAVPLKKDNQSVDSLEIIGKIKDENIDISSKDELIVLKIRDKISLYLKDYEIFYNKNQDSNSSIEESLDINLENCSLNIDENIFKINEAKIDITKDLIKFDATISDLNIPLKKDNSEVKKLDIKGSYKDGIIDIFSKNHDLFLTIKNNSYFIKMDKYDVYYNLEDAKAIEDINHINIIGTYSNIVLDNSYKVLSDFYEIDIRKDRKFFYLEHEGSNISAVNSGKNIDIYASNIDDTFINALLNADIMNDGKVDFYANGNLEKIKAKVIVKDSSVRNLSILNNIMFLIQGTPALINPLLAIPSAFSLSQLGIYKIEEGIASFEYNFITKLLEIKNLNTVGSGMDFEGEGVVDLNKEEIDLKVKMIFLKHYSSFFENIPILNYILLGEDKRVETHLEVYGDLNNPEIKTNLIRDGFSAPINIFKRVFTSPFNLIMPSENK